MQRPRRQSIITGTEKSTRVRTAGTLCSSRTFHTDAFLDQKKGQIATEKKRRARQKSILILPRWPSFISMSRGEKEETNRMKKPSTHSMAGPTRTISHQDHQRHQKQWRCAHPMHKQTEVQASGLTFFFQFLIDSLQVTNLKSLVFQ